MPTMPLMFPSGPPTMQKPPMAMTTAGGGASAAELPPAVAPLLPAPLGWGGAHSALWRRQSVF